MTIHFPDVSHYQEGLSLSGAVAVIAKATEGTGYRDSSYHDFKSQAANLGIPFCAYHWMNTTDIGAQARFTFDYIGPDVPLMWDCEDDGVTVPRIVEATNALRELGGKPVCVYLPRWYWDGHMGAPDLTPLVEAGLYLISSHYTSYSDSGPGWNAYGGMAPTQWQYTSSYPFNGMAIDFNAFKGSVEELDALWQGEGEYDVSSDYTWGFIEEGVRPMKPDTFTPDGYDTMPNNWLGSHVSMARQDAKRAVDGVAALNAKLDEIINMVRHGRGRHEASGD